MASTDVKFNRVGKVYRPGDKVTGRVVVRTGSSMKHTGIKLTVEGTVALQLSARSVGLFEAFYSSLKPVELMKYEIEVQPNGTLPSGVTEYPFEFVLKPFSDQQLHDTYHGVYVNVQYKATVDVARPLLSKNLKRSQEFYVEVPSRPPPPPGPPPKSSTAAAAKKAAAAGSDEKKGAEKGGPLEFVVSPASLQNVRKTSKHKVPDFLFEGRLRGTRCDVSKPFTGSLTIRKCAVPIKSIELQLVRVETCTYMEGEAREATEIQNIQLAEGNVIHDLTLPIYMIFPKLFTCSTIVSKGGAFKVEFEINLIVLFADNHMVTENFPIKLFRS